MTDFRDEPYMSAAEKTRVLNAWRRFLKGGLKKTQFSVALYEHLHLRVPFIAHFSRHGFHATYFENGDDTLRFFRTLRDFIEGDLAHLRGPDYQDINRALIAELNKHEPALTETAKAKQKAADLAVADLLLAKHDLSRHA